MAKDMKRPADEAPAHRPASSPLSLRPRLTFLREPYPEVVAYLEALSSQEVARIVEGFVIRGVLTHLGQAQRATDQNDVTSDVHAPARQGASPPSAGQRPRRHNAKNAREPQGGHLDPLPRPEATLAAFGMTAADGGDAFNYSN